MEQSLDKGNGEETSSLEAAFAEARTLEPENNTQEQIEDHLKDGSRAELQTETGKISARVLRYSADGSVDVAYQNASGMVETKTLTAEEFGAQREKSRQQAEAQGETVVSPEATYLPRSEYERFGDFLESVTKESEKDLETVTSSKWQFLKNAGRLLASGVQQVKTAGENMGSTARDIVIDIATPLGKSLGSTADSLPKTMNIDGIEQELVGENEGYFGILRGSRGGGLSEATKGLREIPASLWGAPKEVIKAIEKRGGMQKEQAAFRTPVDLVLAGVKEAARAMLAVQSAVEERVPLMAPDLAPIYTAASAELNTRYGEIQEVERELAYQEEECRKALARPINRMAEKRKAVLAKKVGEQAVLMAKWQNGDDSEKEKAKALGREIEAMKTQMDKEANAWETWKAAQKSLDNLATLEAAAAVKPETKPAINITEENIKSGDDQFMKEAAKMMAEDEEDQEEQLAQKARKARAGTEDEQDKLMRQLAPDMGDDEESQAAA